MTLLERIEKHLKDHHISATRFGRVDERLNGWKPICSQSTLEILKVLSGIGPALDKLLIATGNILPKSCPVLLAGLV